MSGIVELEFDFGVGSGGSSEIGFVELEVLRAGHDCERLDVAETVVPI